MSQLLSHLSQHKTLSYQQAKDTLIKMANKEFSTVEMAAILMSYSMRKISLEEIKGFKDAMLSLCHSVDLSIFNPMDVCGTGADGKDTFNISTLSAFVCAGAGIPIAKHGNYGVSSASGSSTVLQNLEVKFHKDQDLLLEQLDKANICFLHAPLFHPALKEIGPIRKQLGIKTFFNMLGPLTNPAKVKIQLTGLNSLELLRAYQYLFEQNNTIFTVIHALDGYDECSLTSDCKVVTAKSNEIVAPEDFGLSILSPQQIIAGQDAANAAKIFLDVLHNRATLAQSQVVIANSALAIQTYQPNISLLEAVDKAKESLYSKKALNSFQLLQKI